MTRKETAEKLTSLWYFLVNNDYPQKDLDALKVAIKALEQEPKAEVLEKIRAEIDEQYDRVHPYDISCAEGLEMALGIIDKYKEESEGKCKNCKYYSNPDYTRCHECEAESEDKE